MSWYGDSYRHSIAARGRRRQFRYGFGANRLAKRLARREQERAAEQLRRAIAYSTGYGQAYDTAKFVVKHQRPITRALNGKISPEQAGSEIIKREVKERVTDAIIDNAKNAGLELLKKKKRREAAQ